MKRIVIFDDDVDILEILSYLLSESGWEVITYTTCNNIVEVIAHHQPSVILMDNWIPDTGGIKATQKLKQHPELQSIPVIYFSANNDVESLSAQAGADAFIAKPFDLDELERVVSKFV